MKGAQDFERARFMGLVRVHRTFGCWDWRGPEDEHGLPVFTPGPGNSRAEHAAVPAREWAFEHFLAPVPQGQQVVTFCGRQRCLNPMHMVALSQAALARSSATLHMGRCQAGHHFTATNLVRTPHGTICRICALTEHASFQRALRRY